MPQVEPVGTVTFTLTGSISTKTARLSIAATPTPSWTAGHDLLLVAGWLHFVESEVTFIPADLLPLTVGTLIGRMQVYFEYGTLGRRPTQEPDFEHLATAELILTLNKASAAAKVTGSPRHAYLHKKVHPGALISMVITDSPEAIGHSVGEAIIPTAFHAMTFGLEKWARIGMPAKDRIPNTWDLMNIPGHATQGESLVAGGWLAAQTWPLKPFG